VGATGNALCGRWSPRFFMLSTGVSHGVCSRLSIQSGPVCTGISANGARVVTGNASTTPSAPGAIAVTARQNIRLLACRHQLRTSEVHPFICARRSSSWPCLTGCRGQGTAADHCGPRALRLPARRPCLNGGLQVHGIRRGRALIAPTDSGLVQVPPAVAEQGRIQAPIQSPKPGVRVSSCCVG